MIGSGIKRRFRRAPAEPSARRRSRGGCTDFQITKKTSDCGGLFLFDRSDRLDDLNCGFDAVNSG